MGSNPRFPSEMPTGKICPVSGLPIIRKPEWTDVVLGDNPADLSVLDMIMDPGIDGFETCKSVLQIRPGQKAVIASGFSESERVKQA
jgi:CheY-like chemotaxis protein